MRATIELRGLRLTCCVGVPDHERRRPQELVADVVAHYDASNAVESDHISDAVNYSRLAAAVRKAAAEANFRLLERLATILCRVVLDDFPGVTGVSVTIRKPGILDRCDSAGVSITMNRGSDP